MKSNLEKLTLARVSELFVHQGYNFDKIRENVLIYNYDRWNWVGGSFFGWRGANMPFADQVQRVRTYLESDKRCQKYELAGLVMAGVDGFDARNGGQLLGPKLETQGLYHVYNVIMRDARSGNLQHMSRDWVYGGKFDTRKNLEDEIVSLVVGDILVKNGVARQVIFDGLKRQK